MVGLDKLRNKKSFIFKSPRSARKGKAGPGRVKKVSKAIMILHQNGA
jgi:hypothetical protein